MRVSQYRYRRSKIGDGEEDREFSRSPTGKHLNYFPRWSRKQKLCAVRLRWGSEPESKLFVECDDHCRIFSWHSNAGKVLRDSIHAKVFTTVIRMHGTRHVF